MSASLSGVFSTQQFTDAGALAANYRLYTYTPSTTTHKVAYTDEAASVPHTYTNDGLGGQYIALNSRGEIPAPLFLTTGGYDLTLKAPDGVTVWTRRAIGSTDSTSALLADIAVNGLQAANVRGGAGANSNLVLRSTSGAGTTLPATTADTIIFQRGNNGSQELGRFTPGGSFGVGDFTDGTAVNVHAGDDGTTTRVTTVRAKTAALFIGATDRDNSESGGPVGRSVVSFEGYRLANLDGSRESGAVRVITEGVSADKLGARVGILTRRDGFTDADFVERFAVQNDGNVYHGGGNGGVGNANRGGIAYGSTVYTISGQTGRSVIEMTTNAADADGVVIGDKTWLANFQTDEKRIAILQGYLTGPTATKRGGEIRHYLKPDNGALSESFRETPAGIKDANPYGTLQAAPTLAISTNVITPVRPISFVGAGLVKTITVPANFTGHGGQITLIPTAAFTTDTTGNIAIASTAVIGRAMTLTYDGGTAKWYPSY